MGSGEFRPLWPEFFQFLMVDSPENSNSLEALHSFSFHFTPIFLCFVLYGLIYFGPKRANNRYIWVENLGRDMGFCLGLHLGLEIQAQPLSSDLFNKISGLFYFSFSFFIWVEEDFRPKK